MIRNRPSRELERPPSGTIGASIDYPSYRVGDVSSASFGPALIFGSVGGIGARIPTVRAVINWPSSFQSTVTHIVDETSDYAGPVARTSEEIRAEIAVNRDLAQLVDLEPGWLDGAGEAVHRLAIQNAKRVLVKLLSGGLPAPQVVPTPEGGVQAEWSFDDRESSITFEPSGAAYAFWIDLDTQEIDEGTFENLDIEQMGQIVFRGA
jgi:hypothetical protein